MLQEDAWPTIVLVVPLHHYRIFKVRIVELRYFGGLSLDETAEALGLSVTTISHEMSVTRAWLRREIET